MDGGQSRRRRWPGTGAAERHPRRARRRLGEAVPGAAEAALTLAARMEMGMYSAEGADLDDARWPGKPPPRSSGRPRRRPRPATGSADGSIPAGCCGPGDGSGRRSQRRITLTPRGDLEAERELVGSDDHA